jgi:hypothetical protein
MSIKSMVNLLLEIKNSRIEDMFSDDMTQKIAGARKELSKCADLASETVLSRLSEGDFVRLMLMVQKSTIAALIADGHFTLAQADMASDELQAYTHSVILATIGLLIQEEIL